MRAHTIKKRSLYGGKKTLFINKEEQREKKPQAAESRPGFGFDFTLISFPPAAPSSASAAKTQAQPLLDEREREKGQKKYNFCRSARAPICEKWLETFLFCHLITAVILRTFIVRAALAHSHPQRCESKFSSVWPHESETGRERDEASQRYAHAALLTPIYITRREGSSGAPAPAGKQQFNSETNCGCDREAL